MTVEQARELGRLEGRVEIFRAFQRGTCGLGTILDSDLKQAEQQLRSLCARLEVESDYAEK
jgi:hypothetical protein